MKRIRRFISFPLLVLFLALAPTALASTTWYVNGVSGSDNNDCKSPTTACKTIGHAISLASSGDSIMVAASTYTENFTIGISLKIIGAGASTTIIDGGHVNRVVKISTAAAVVTLSGLAIRNGYAPYGGGVFNNGVLTISYSLLSKNTAEIPFCFPHQFCSGGGGGIYNSGTLTISNSTLAYNSAQGKYPGCAGECSTFGGGVLNLGQMIMSNSIVLKNTSSSPSGFALAHGGGICNEGKNLTVTNSTFDGNSSGEGGGIKNVGGSLTVTNSTFDGNSSGGGTGGGIMNNSGSVAISNSTLSNNSAYTGGGISNFGTVALKNSIVGKSTSGGNCYGTMTSKGYNLSSDNTCSFNGPGDLNNTDPKLGTLGNYGGPTQTIPLLSGSPAIDAGNPSGCTDGQGNLLKTDQRGMPRPDPEDTGGCDMGAYESQSD